MQYRYEKCKEFVQMQKKDSYLARFSFLDILEVAEERSAETTKEVIVEISNPMKKNWQHRNAKSDNDLIKVLCAIAIKDGLMKGLKKITINGDTYPGGIDRFEELGMEEGLEFVF
jgi:hypothetical protein